MTSIFLGGLIEADINECVHYCAFRYGHGEYHPYETYVLKLHQGEHLLDIRAEFEDFLKYFRPSDLGQALGVRLNKFYPMWLFPWSRAWKFWRPNLHTGWCRTPNSIPDIITHFSEDGIPRWMVEREMGWLRGAYEAIAGHGYLPEIYGYPKGRLMLGATGKRVFLLLDGNHRVSALSALGYKSFQINCSRWDVVDLSDLEKWPGVRNGFFLKDDAERIFSAYINGNHNFRLGDGEVAILD